MSQADQRLARRLAARAAGRHPAPISEGRSRNMQAIRRRDTGPERALRSELHRAGYRFRKDLRLALSEGYARPDIVFTRRRLAIFVDGCFWHACPEHGRRPTQHEEYWNPKLAGNVRRDERQTRLLQEQGWRVLRFWAHVPTEEMFAAVEAALVAAIESESC